MSTIHDLQLTFTQGVGSFAWKSIINDFARSDDFYLPENPETGSPKPVGWSMLADDSEAEEEDDDDSSGYDEEEEEEAEEEEEDDEEFDDNVTDEDVRVFPDARAQPTVHAHAHTLLPHPVPMHARALTTTGRR